ncbi:MAG TPA: protein phosphatase 2C domain-containing protein [Candidatus Acidoferrales bacterium]|nr:protein phosphatase 2C domain-containing protein [Candidatus Acidoferrales bacterium]
MSKVATGGIPELTLSTGAATDTGRLRDRNEDRYFLDAVCGVFLVADGVGGQAAGELAAQIAVETIRECLAMPDAQPQSGTDHRLSCSVVPRPPAAGPRKPADERVRTAITEANNRIFERARDDAGLAGMACVLTLALVEDGRVTIGHVGDSRLYLIWNGAIRKLTSDHSPVGEDEDSGELTEAEAMLHPRRNEVFRDVGSRWRQAGDREFIEIRECRFRPDAALLLCSDGLTDQLTAAQVQDIVERYDGDARGTAANLVEAANEAGGKDNITALFIAGPDFRQRSGATRPRLSTTRLRRPARVFTGRMAFLTYGLLLGMLLWAVLRTRG